MAMTSKTKPRVVIVGAGFGGLNAARSLVKEPVQIIIVDRKNHHTFQPLLYQVATAGLSPGEIAAPIRGVFRGDDNVIVLLEEVEGFDLERRVVRTSEQELAYDYLIVAAGATHAYFGHDDWEPFAPGLKTLEDATAMRRRLLVAFEIYKQDMFVVFYGMFKTGKVVVGFLDTKQSALPRAKTEQHHGKEDKRYPAGSGLRPARKMGDSKNQHESENTDHGANQR